MDAYGQDDIDHAYQAETKRRRRWRKVIIGLIVAGIMLLLTPIAIRLAVGWSVGDQLQAEIDRIRAAGEPILPEDFDLPPVPDDQNGALLIKQAAELVDKHPSDPNVFNWKYDDEAQIAKDAAKFDKLLADLAEVRKLARQARDMPKTDWDVRMRSPVLDDMVPEVAERGPAKLLRIAAIRALQTGDQHEAVEILRDILGIARHIDRQPVLICHLVAVGIQSLAVNQVEPLAPELSIGRPTAKDQRKVRPATRQQVEAFIDALLDTRPSQQAFVEAFHAERMYMLDTGILLMQGKTIALNPTTLKTVARPSKAVYVASLVFRPILQNDALFYLDFMARWIDAASEPAWPAFHDKAPSAAGLSGVWQFIQHPLSSMYLPMHAPSQAHAAKSHYRSIAMRRLAAIRLAMRLYEVDTGKRPTKLADLVPKYLDAIPPDPFAEGNQPLRMNLGAEKPVLYSVNLNGVDDSGAYGFEPDPDGRVDWEAKDLVFFVNGDRPEPDPNVATQAETAPDPAATTPAR